MIRTLITPLLLAALTGCASVEHAGTASYRMKPMLLDGRAVCCEVEIVNGKEYAQLKARVKKTGDDYEFELDERGVAAFAGQREAAGVAGRALDAVGGVLP